MTNSPISSDRNIFSVKYFNSSTSLSSILYILKVNSKNKHKVDQVNWNQFALDKDESDFPLLTSGIFKNKYYMAWDYM